MDRDGPARPGQPIQGDLLADGVSGDVEPDVNGAAKDVDDTEKDMDEALKDGAEAEVDQPEEARAEGGGPGEAAVPEPSVADEGPPDDPDRARLARARELVSAGRAEEAVELYRQIVSDRPRNLKAHNNLGVLYDELGQHELALEQFLAARDVDPENIEVMTNVGSALGALGRFEEAERELRKAQRLAPDAVEVRASLGILFFRRGLYAQAEAELRWVCEQDYDHGPAHFYRGEALNRLGEVDTAIEVLERAVRLQPENAKAYYTLGILFDRKYMREEAGRMYRRYRELSSR